jgi:hypothetical protein
MCQQHFFKSTAQMNSGDYHQNGSAKQGETDLDIKQTEELLQTIQDQKRRVRIKKKYAQGTFFGITANEVIGYSVMLMFFVLSAMVYLGALVPEWATTDYRNILMTVMFLYGLYRGVTTFARANQRKRRIEFESQREENREEN